MSRSKVQDTSQYLDNQSWDDAAGLPMVELAGTDGASVLKVNVLQSSATPGKYGLVIVNADGTAVGGGAGGGGTQYVDAAATPAHPTGTMPVFDKAGTISEVSLANGLPVNVVAGSGSGLSVTDEAAWTAGTSQFVPGGGVFNDTAAALTSGQQGSKRLTPNRADHVNLRNNSGTEIGTSATPVRTDPTGTTTQPVSGTLTANAGTNLNTSALALETGGNLATIASAVSAPGSVFNGKTTVTTAGTRVTLAASQAVKSVTVKALAANTGTIYVGNSSVASTNGFQLAAGDTISLDISNLNTVNLDSSVNGEGVTYLGVN